MDNEDLKRIDTTLKEIQLCIHGDHNLPGLAEKVREHGRSLDRIAFDRVEQRLDEVYGWMQDIKEERKMNRTALFTAAVGTIFNLAATILLILLR